jgi:hypothetical protein
MEWMAWDSRTKAQACSCLRSFERHAADDESLRLLSEDGRFAFPGLFETVEFADSRIIFDGSKCVVGHGDRAALDVLEQVLGDRLLRAVQDFDSDDGGALILDAEAAERLGDLSNKV